MNFDIRTISTADLACSVTRLAALATEAPTSSTPMTSKIAPVLPCVDFGGGGAPVQAGGPGYGCGGG